MMKAKPYHSQLYAGKVFWRLVNQWGGGSCTLAQLRQRLADKYFSYQDTDVYVALTQVDRCIATLGPKWKALT